MICQYWIQKLCNEWECKELIFFIAFLESTWPVLILAASEIEKKEGNDKLGIFLFFFSFFGFRVY